MLATLLKNAAYFDPNWNQRTLRNADFKVHWHAYYMLVKTVEQMPQRLKNTALYHLRIIISTHVVKTDFTLPKGV
jgi:hypothetical protein